MKLLICCFIFFSLISPVVSFSCPYDTFLDRNEVKQYSVIEQKFLLNLESATNDMGAATSSTSSHAYRALSISTQLIQIFHNIPHSHEIGFTELALAQFKKVWKSDGAALRAFQDIAVEIAISASETNKPLLLNRLLEFVNQNNMSTGSYHYFKQGFLELNAKLRAPIPELQFDAERFRQLVESIRKTYYASSSSEGSGNIVAQAAVGQFARYWERSEIDAQQALMQSVLSALVYTRNYGNILYFIRAMKEMDITIQNSPQTVESRAIAQRLYDFAKTYRHSSTTYEAFLSQFGVPIF